MKRLTFPVFRFIKRKILDLIPDKPYLYILYGKKLRRILNLKNPQTFNEKLQWLKLYDRNPLYATLVDKYAVKDYVANIIGNEYIIPTLGVYDSFDDIDFNSLPNSFVLKCTHDSGSIVIVKDKESFDLDKKAKLEAKHKLTKALKRNYYWSGREWPYKNVPPRIIAEKYLTDESGYELKDYKVFNFNGEPKVIQVDFDRFVKHKRRLYNTDWKPIEAQLIYAMGEKNKASIAKPEALKEMLELAKKLSQNISFVRTDFYSIEDKLYFGELTFYPESGFGTINPPEFGITMGNWIQLPNGGGVLINNSNNGYLLYIHSSEKQVHAGKERTDNNLHSDLRDFKFFCFNGEVKAMFIASDRFTPNEETKFDFFDADFNHLPFTHGHPNAKIAPQKPKNFLEMKFLAEKLSAGIPQVRIDFYEVNAKTYFGEFTFFHHNGMVPFKPDKWDSIFGEWIKLPEITR